MASGLEKNTECASCTRAGVPQCRMCEKSETMAPIIYQALYLLRANTGGAITAVLLKLSKAQDLSSKLRIADWCAVVLHTTSTRLTPQVAHHARPATTKLVDFLYHESTYMSLLECCGNVKSLYVSKILSQFLYTSHCGKISNSWLATQVRGTYFEELWARALSSREPWVSGWERDTRA